MPVSRKYDKDLSETERQQLTLALIEAKRRGLPIPKVERGKDLRWPVAPNGYFTHRAGKLYNPTENQGGFINSKAVYALFVGSRGSGKTASGAQKALKKISQGEPGSVLNPDFENFKYSTWPEFKEWIPWEMVVPNQRYRSATDWEPHKPFTLVFMNGVRVSCKGLKDPDSARGPNINWLWYDEGGRDDTGLSWQLAIASVRIGKNPQAWVTATPAGLYHWMYDFFIEQNIPEDALKAFKEAGIGEGRPFIEVFEGSISDNKANLDPTFYASMLAAYPEGYLREQEIFGQFVAEGGTLGNRAWFNDKIVSEAPEGVKARVRYWDLAASEKKIGTKKKRNDPDETVGTKLSWDGEDFFIEHQHCGYWKWKQIKDEIRKVAEKDGPYVPIYVEREPGSGGINQVAEIQIMIEQHLGTQWTVKPHPPEGDKIQRANVWFAEAAEGKFYLVESHWNDGFLKQVGGFPLMRHDDRVDSVSGARAVAAPIKKWKEVSFIKL